MGLATALALVEKGRRSLIVVEAEDRLAAHQTGNNSGVVHSGLYYKPASKKAVLCVKGREALYAFCAEHGVRHERCGKIVVATREDELDNLAELERRGTENGLEGLTRIGPEQAKEHEPHVAALAALWVPQTGIVDYVQLAETYARLAAAGGADIRKAARVEAVQSAGSTYVLETTLGPVEARHVIGCAGLMADRVAAMCGLSPEVRVVPFRGEYYHLVKEREHLVKNLIYPVPDPQFPFLGVHFTRMARGGVEAGPNAVLAFKRYGYRWRDVSLQDLWGLATYGGFWRLVGRHWRAGVDEAYRSFFKRAFLSGLRRLIPELTANDIIPAGAGVRAQAVNPNGRLVDDFHFERAERMIHVLNAPSPAATASIVIGEAIAHMACQAW